MTLPPKKHSRAVVYFPTCVNRVFGSYEQKPLSGVIMELLDKAGYDVIVPDKLPQLCCGLAFESKGFPSQSDQKHNELVQVLNKVSNNGQFPILVDASPCLLHTKTHLGLINKEYMRLFFPRQK